MRTAICIFKDGAWYPVVELSAVANTVDIAVDTAATPPPHSKSEILLRSMVACIKAMVMSKGLTVTMCLFVQIMANSIVTILKTLLKALSWWLTPLTTMMTVDDDDDC